MQLIVGGILFLAFIVLEIMLGKALGRVFEEGWQSLTVILSTHGILMLITVLWASVKMAQPLIAAAAVCGMVAIAAYTTYAFMGWKIMLVFCGIAIMIGVALLLLYSCRRWNWCQRFSAWWLTTAWPAIRQGFRDLWTWMVPIIHAGLAVFRDWLGRNIFLVLSVISGVIAYHYYYDEMKPLFWGQSREFYIALVAVVFFLFLHSKWLRDRVAEVMLAIVGAIYRGYVGHFRSLPTGWQLLLVCSLPITGIGCWLLWKNHHRDNIQMVVGAGVFVFVFAHIGDAVQRAFRANNPWHVPPRPRRP